MPAVTGSRADSFNNWLEENKVALNDLFLDLEQVLKAKGLLRSDFKQYRNHHFAEFCRNVFRHSSAYAYSEITG